MLNHCTSFNMSFKFKSKSEVAREERKKYDELRNKMMERMEVWGENKKEYLKIKILEIKDLLRTMHKVKVSHFKERSSFLYYINLFLTTFWEEEQEDMSKTNAEEINRELNKKELDLLRMVTIMEELDIQI